MMVAAVAYDETFAIAAETNNPLGLFATVANLFRHGFIRAFKPTIEGSVHADNVLPNGKSADGAEVAKNTPEKN